jgi:hypothetical protein
LRGRRDAAHRRHGDRPERSREMTMDTLEKTGAGATRSSGPRLIAVVGAGLVGLVVGLAVGAIAMSGSSSPSADADPAHIIASTVDDLNTAYVYGDISAIDAIFGDHLVFNPGEGPDLVGPAGADFFKQNAGTGAEARRITEPLANADGTYMFVMEVLPPNQLQPLVFENDATVEDGRVVRIEQGDRVLPDLASG